MARTRMAQLLNKAQDLLEHTYSRNELKQLLWREMDLDLDGIAPNATEYVAVVFEVLTWMDRRGRVHELIRVASDERPGVQDWKDLVGELPPAPSPEEAMIAAVAPAGAVASSKTGPPDEVRALVRGYGRLRRVLPDGDQKTVQLQALVNQLLELPLEAHGLADLFHLSDSDGERLVAVLTLVRKPDIRYVRWLAERIAVEGKFVGYQAALALEAAARTLAPIDLDVVMAAVDSAREWIPQAERLDKGRWKKLGQALETITRRSAGTT